MKGFALRSGVLHVLVLSVLLGVCLCGRGEAGKSDDVIAKLQSMNPAESDYASAVEELRKGADDRVVKALIRVVEERRDNWKLQISAIRLLGEIGNPLAAEVLIKVVTDGIFTNECPALKWNGIVALGSFRNDPRVVAALVYRLDEDTLYLREAVIQSLGRIGDRETFPYLVAALGDKHFAVRMSAIKALETMEDSKAIPFLQEIAKNDADLLVRDEALKALGLLN
ncbi:MAG TPA: HEAT repeat domain-containing protein [Thermodesulfovibrionales bacterium]|nr:HEAT repeat domain-containing protein [Thermodesulfovibrionales bacterium]